LQGIVRRGLKDSKTVRLRARQREGFCLTNAEKSISEEKKSSRRHEEKGSSVGKNKNGSAQHSATQTGEREADL